MKKISYWIIGAITIFFLAGCSSESKSLAGEYYNSVKGEQIYTILSSRPTVTFYQYLYISDDESEMELEVNWLESSPYEEKTLYTKTYIFDLKDGNFSNDDVEGTIKLKNGKIILNSSDWNKPDDYVVDNGTFSKKGSNDYSKIERDFEKTSNKADN